LSQLMAALKLSEANLATVLWWLAGQPVPSASLDFHGKELT